MWITLKNLTKTNIFEMILEFVSSTFSKFSRFLWINLSTILNSITMINQVLLIDDDAINNFLNEKIIIASQLAQEVTTFIRAEDAIHYLEETCVQQKSKCPELILLDISMPHLDGFDFIQIYNKLKIKKENTTIAILTSSDDERDVRKVRAMGIEHYLVKPLDLSAFSKLLDKISNNNKLSLTA
ncbi:MAG: response regulator [Cytophagales bacterium]|nr:MAG: response regulator [Cytophagales bacterium]